MKKKIKRRMTNSEKKKKHETEIDKMKNNEWQRKTNNTKIKIKIKRRMMNGGREEK